MGDPTEVALFTAAQKAAFDKETLIKDFPRIDEIPFDSERKCMTTFHEDLRIQGSRDSGERIDSALESSNPRSLEPFQVVSFTKGAIDALLEKSSGVLTSEGRKPLAVAEIMNVNDRMAADGLRVIGIAVRALETRPVNITPDTSRSDLLRGRPHIRRAL